MLQRERELQVFALSWQDKPKAQVYEELASWEMETDNIPDTYTFRIDKDGKFLSKETGFPIELSIERVSHIGRLEFEAVEKMQNWNVGKTEGVMLWLSPKRTEEDDRAKIIVSEIINSGNTRELFNRSIMFDKENEDCISMANNLSQKSEDAFIYQIDDDVRREPIFLDPKEQNWKELLKNHIEDPRTWHLIEESEDIKLKQIALSHSPEIYEELFPDSKVIYPKGFDDNRVKKALDLATQRNLLGKSKISCPPSRSSGRSAFGVFESNSYVVDAYFNCPKCGGKIPSGFGITVCPNRKEDGTPCGARKEDYGNCT